MKKFKFLGVLAIVLLFAFTGCSSDSDPESLTFANTEVEFKIDENLDFSVRFLTADSSVDLGSGPIPITKYATISGSILSADNKWNDPEIEGEVSKIESKEPAFEATLPLAVGQLIKLAYDYDTNDAITQIQVDFPLPPNYAYFAFLVQYLDLDDDDDFLEIIGHLVDTGFLEEEDAVNPAIFGPVLQGVYGYLLINQACNELMCGHYDIK